MKFEEEEECRTLSMTRTRNNRVSWLIHDYLEDNPHVLFAEQLKSMEIPAAEGVSLFRMFFINYCKELDEENGQEDSVTDYLEASLRVLDPRIYASDPYYKDIRIPHAKEGRWELYTESYQPFEAFVCDDIRLDDDFRETPQVGFFTEPFSFPAVKESDHEWMSVKPNEVETMRSAIAAAEGEVLAFGLGLGYFAYMASLKDAVSSVTIVERDKAVIDLFQEYILPQFSTKRKIRILHADAFDVAKDLAMYGTFRFAFVDLWHDVSDGLPLYLRMKKLEKLSSSTQFSYWVEESLLSALRWKVFNAVLAHADSYDQIIRELSDSNLKRFATR